MFACFVAIASLWSGAPDVAPDSVVVTATRTPRSIDDALAPVTLLRRADIERLQARDLSELLAGLPGVQIANSGGRGKSTSLFMRGANPDHVLVLIDGLRVGSATTGTTPLEQIPLDQIERIEIVRGPRSSLYGSEALGGMIQIFTRRSHGRAPAATFSAGGGTHGSSQMQAGVNGGADHLWYSASVSGLETEGIDARPVLDQPDRDGFWNVAGSLRGGWRFSDGAEVSMSWLRIESENEFDGTAQDESRNTQQVFGAAAHFEPFERWRVSLITGESVDDGENLFRGVFSTRFTTRRESASWQNDVRLAADQTLSLGVDYQADRLGGTTAYAVDSRENTGSFAQYQGRFGRHDVQLSIRRDDNQQFGAHATGGVAWGYGFADGLKLTASHGQAFKAPTFNQLYFPGFGNPDLAPERSRSSELGVSATSASWSWSVNAYESRIENLIVNVTLPVGLRPANVGRARIRGLEAQAGASWNVWRVQGFFTALQPVDRSGGANSGNLLPRRARHSGRIEIDRETGRLGIGATLNGVGRRFDNAANTVRLAGYGTLDLRAQYRFAHDWLLQAQAANVFDRRYETTATFAQPGRALFFNVRYAAGTP